MILFRININYNNCIVYPNKGFIFASDKHIRVKVMKNKIYLQYKLLPQKLSKIISTIVYPLWIGAPIF
jgi:hypothetical protein